MRNRLEVPTWRRSARRFFVGAMALWLALFGIAFEHVRAIDMEWVMYHDPELKIAPIERGFPPGLVDRWVLALKRPEREMKRRAAASVVRARKIEVPGLAATVAPLCRVLEEAGQDRPLRLAAARALVAMEAKQAAPLLVEVANEGDLEMAEIVEPALARWGHSGMRDRWLERLRGEITLHRAHVLACRGLAALGEPEALPRLLELAEDGLAPADVRLASAEALAALQESGLLEEAAGLSRDKSAASVIDRLVAAKILARHRGQDVEALLLELGTDDQSAVQAIALGHLFAIDPGLILPIVEEIMASRDANVRRLGADTLISEATPETLAFLGPMLDDADPAIRRHVCDSLLDLASDSELREAVVSQGRRMLNESGWRGQEQSILLLVSLGDTSIVTRLLELLDVNRPEVHVAAAWGLCLLAVPETAEPIFEKFQAKTESQLAREPQVEEIGNQMALLAQALAVMNYTPADECFRKYIPKGVPLAPTSRAAAIWALGHLHEDAPDRELVRLFRERLLDAFSQEPEDPQVCTMSAVSLGRMKAADALPALRRAYVSESLNTNIGYASMWAIWRITGEEIPELRPYVQWDTDWFLIPAVNY